MLDISAEVLKVWEKNVDSRGLDWFIFIPIKFHNMVFFIGEILLRLIW